MARKTVLITGGTGQVGLELLRQSWPADVTLLAPSRAELDLGSGCSIAEWFAERTIDCIINAAAFTAVDLAEGLAGEAFLANAQGPAWLADIARNQNIPLLHVSTDYVFGGTLNRSYQEDDDVGPLGVYGSSKLAGELAVRAAAPRHVILRTAWVVSAQRNNFLKTMLRLATEHPQLRIVADQQGSPTSARDIAATLRTISLAHITDPNAPCGTYHFVNAGKTTWHGLAEAIMTASEQHGGPHVPVVPIGSADFPTAARRPTNSCLDPAKLRRDFGVTPRPWQEAVNEIVNELLSAETRITK